MSVILWNFRDIKECQFIQENETKLTVNIVKRESYKERVTHELIKTLKNVIDARLNININFVEDIPRTKMGKFPFIVNHAITPE